MDISVVIPAFNSQKYIKPCLESIANQKRKPFEIIVVDDASTDDTAEISKNYAQVISNNRSKGAGGARNTGAYFAQGEIIVFIDSDCIAPADWLEKIEEAFTKGYYVVAGGYSGYIGNSFISKIAFWEQYLRRVKMAHQVKTAVSNNFAISKNIFQESKGFPEYFPQATLEDMIFSFKVGQKYPICWLNKNGIKHNFPTKLLSYLQQQYRFGRDTVVTYALFPQLTQIRTYQGRRIYLETLVTFLLFVTAFFSLKYLLAAFLLLWILNLRLLLLLYDKEKFIDVLVTLLFIPLRNLVWVISVFAGFLTYFVKYRNISYEDTDS